jgi:hypothetical protein
VSSKDAFVAEEEVVAANEWNGPLAFVSVVCAFAPKTFQTLWAPISVRDVVDAVLVDFSLRGHCRAWCFLEILSFLRVANFLLLGLSDARPRAVVTDLLCR